jgi:DNA/RNA endonuclease G (NUC1)
VTEDEGATYDDYQKNRDEKITLFDRGHLAPNADMLRSPQAQAYTFYLSNMAPQLSPFNQHLWAHFEGIGTELDEISEGGLHHHGKRV